MIGMRNPDLPPVDLRGTPLEVPVAAPIPVKHGPNWIAILADALSGFAGQPGQYPARMERQREEQSAFERGEQLYHLRQQGERADYLWRQQHPDPTPKDELSRMMDAAGIPADQRPGIYRQKVDALTAPPMMSAMGVDEQGNPVMRFFPRAAPLPRVVPALPPGAVPIGGAGPQTPRPFP